MTSTAAQTSLHLDSVDAVLASLTLEEKASLLDGSDFWRTQAVERAGVPAVMVTDGPHGLRKQPEEGDHLGIGGSVPATCFPPAAGLASSWDVDLLERVGTALGQECRAEGVAVLLGPGVNMKRTPLCGRNFEYFSEDPVLAGDLAAALVRGVQSQGVGTSLKHFAANNQETHRMSVSAEVDERTLREVYLTAFERVVRDAQPWTVMCSYNRINGVYASQDPWLLTQVLREEWGFSGLVVSDWGAVDDRPLGVAAGLDLEMPSSSGAGTAKVLAAVRDGRLGEDDVDRAARRVLELVAKAQPGLASPQPYDVSAHHALAREAAQRSAVLLKNDAVPSASGGAPLLPLPADATGAVAVIGEMARTPRYQGAGSSQVVPTQLDDALAALTDGLQAGLEGSRDVRFAAGYTTTTEDADAALVAEAVDAARGADVVLLFLGLPGSYESEGFDRSHLDLPAQQLALLEAVLEVNRRVVVVLSNGSAVQLHPWVERVPAVLEGWLLGQAGGSALADLLLGVVSPSGRLAETLPLALSDTPAFGNFPGEAGVVRYGEGVLIGYRWYDARRLPVSFPFGHGLTYTTFEHTDLAVEVTGSGASAGLEVALTVTNTGSREATEVVQVYVSDVEATVTRPDAELKAFARVALAPGEAQRVQFTLPSRDLAFWSAAHGRWVVEGGAFEVRVGASSRDVRLRSTVVVDGEELTAPVSLEAEISDWLAHPAAGSALRSVLERSGGAFAGMVDDPEHGPMFRAIPLVRMARFPGFPATEAELQALADEANAS